MVLGAESPAEAFAGFSLAENKKQKNLGQLANLAVSHCNIQLLARFERERLSLRSADRVAQFFFKTIQPTAA